MLVLPLFVSLCDISTFEQIYALLFMYSTIIDVETAPTSTPKPHKRRMSLPFAKIIKRINTPKSSMVSIEESERCLKPFRLNNGRASVASNRDKAEQPDAAEEPLEDSLFGFNVNHTSSGMFP